MISSVYKIFFFLAFIVTQVNCEVSSICNTFIFGNKGNEVSSSCKISSGDEQGFAVETLLIVSGKSMELVLSPPSKTSTGRHFNVKVNGKLVLKKLTLSGGRFDSGSGCAVNINAGGIGSFTNVIFSDNICGSPDGDPPRWPDQSGNCGALNSVGQVTLHSVQFSGNAAGSNGAL